MKKSTPLYVPLEVTSNFSFLRSGSHPEELVLGAVTLGLPAVAIADRLAGLDEGRDREAQQLVEQGSQEIIRVPRPGTDIAFENQAAILSVNIL